MVRLVVLTCICMSFLSACSVLPKSERNNDPKVSQSTEPSTLLTNEIQALDEGLHHPAVHVLLTQAEQARQQNNNKQALAYLDQARQIQPRNSAIFYRQAWLNYQLGEMVQARHMLQRAQVFLRKSVANFDVLQRRISALQARVDAQLFDE